MAGKGTNRVVLWALLACSAALSVQRPAAGQQRAVLGGVLRGNGVVAVGALEEPGAGPRPIPLINIDEEMGGYLNDAQEMIARREYARAIEVLQALLGRVEQCFVPTPDPRRYVSLALRVTEVIGKMPPEGLKLYRSLHDAQAEQLFARAASERDEAALGDIVRRLFHTSYGDDALNLLGAIYFDRGEFSQAGRCWQDIYHGHSQSDLDPAALLGKIVVAHHFAGEKRRAEEALELLRSSHPRAQAVLAGKKQNVLNFASKTMLTAPPRYVAVAAALDDWRSMAGAPDSVAVMSSCRPVLSPRWTRPGGKIEENPNVRSVVGALFPISRYGGSNAQQSQVWLREGQVFVVTRSGNRVQRTPVPATIHPVVVGNSVLYRGAEGISAHDLYTGEKLWASFAFPLHRSLPSSSRQRYYTPYAAAVADPGMWTLTVGEGKVFAVGKFAPDPGRYYPGMVARQQGQVADTSVLAAFSVAGEGRLLWRAGDGEGGTDILQGCKFLTAPTCAASRLYVMAEYLQAHHLLCLSAENAQLLWSAMVGQMPVPPGRYSSRYRPMSCGSPPAVADGRVFAVTNAGVLAAFDARSGRALWAYQYASSVAPSLRPQKYGQVTSAYPPNPIVVAKGKAICLPADGEELLAVRVDTGERVWSVSRNAQHHLAAVADTRLLLAGGGLSILDAASGERLWSAGTVKDVFGRPAVTEDAVLASGKGEIIRVSLSDFSVARPPLVRTDGILGNLVCVQGKLLAANAAGVSAYFAYADARAELSQRISKAGTAELPGLMYQRGMNAFNAGKPAEAMGDLLKVHQQAQHGGDAGMLAKAEQALYRAYVSLGNRASDPAEGVSHFTRALALAYSDRSRGEMLLRLSKHHEQAGRHGRAAELAHRLTVEYADTDLVDVDIGPGADPFVRDDSDTPRASGYELGHRRIKDLIGAYGQTCYAAFDAKAKASLNAAAAGNDAEACLRVVETYRHSDWAPAALLMAAQSCYNRAAGAPKPQRSEQLGLADQYLGRVIREYADSPLVPSAWLGLAMVRHQRNPKIVWLALRGLEKLEPTAQATFAGNSGSVQEILKRLGSLRRPSPPPRPALPRWISPPLRPLLSVGKDATVILRGADGGAVRLGESVFLLRDDRLSRFDTAAATAEKAVRWETKLPVETDRIYRVGFSAWAFTLAAGLSSDDAALAVITRGGFVGLDPDTGQVLWSHDAAHPAVGRMYAVVMAEDQFVILANTGEIMVFDKRTGRQIWRHRVAQNQLPWRVVPQIAGGLLLVGHGRTELAATVFDMNTRKSLGSVSIGPFGAAQAYLTADGLLVVCDGSSLKLVEPVSGMGQPIWSVGLGSGLRPRILFATDSYVLVAPNINQGLIQRHSLADDGRVLQTYRTALAKGRQALPVRATVAGDRLYVLAGATATGSYVAPNVRMVSYSKEPSLHGFDLTTGKRLWQPVSLSPAGGGTYVYAMPFEIGRRYICTLSKAQPFTRPATLKIVDSVTGKVVQDPITVPGVQAGRELPHQYMMLGTSPVMTNGRLILDTPKGVVVFGKRD